MTCILTFRHSKRIGLRLRVLNPYGFTPQLSCFSDLSPEFQSPNATSVYLYYKLYTHVIVGNIRSIYKFIYLFI